MRKMLSKKQTREVMDSIIKGYIENGNIYNDWCLERLCGQLSILCVIGIITEKERHFIRTAIEEIHYQKMKF